MDIRNGTLIGPTDEHLPEWVTTEATYNGELADSSQLPPHQTSALLVLQPTQPARSWRSPGEPKHAQVYRRPSTGFEAHRRPVPRHARVPDRTERRWLWDALAHPGFRPYFAGSVVSNLATWLRNTAQALLAYQLTHSVLAIEAVNCTQFSWVPLLGPWTGRVVSRTRSVRRLLVITQLASATAAAAMAALQFAGLLTEERLIAGALGLGLA